MFRRKSDIPPYEIMRPGGREALRQPASSWRSPRQREQPPSTGGKFSLSDWLTGGEPVTLRLPKGMALLIVVGLLLLVLVAYWVGKSQGEAASDARYQKQMQAVRDTQIAAAPMLLDSSSGSAEQKSQQNKSAKGVKTNDPRVKGLNYPILAQCTLPEARHLGAFLAERGVETFIVSGKNEELFDLVGLHGLPGDKGFQAASEAYKKELQRLGREWKAQNGGQGEDLSSIWWRKYE